MYNGINGAFTLDNDLLGLDKCQDETREAFGVFPFPSPSLHCQQTMFHLQPSNTIISASHVKADLPHSSFKRPIAGDMRLSHFIFTNMIRAIATGVCGQSQEAILSTPRSLQLTWTAVGWGSGRSQGCADASVEVLPVHLCSPDLTTCTKSAPTR